MSPAVSIRKSTQKDIQFSKTLTEVQTEYGLPSLEELEHEIDGYVDILLGREPSPISSPYLSMMEVATAYHARGQEIDMIIHRGERSSSILKSSPYYKFRTGELRAFLELTKKCAELGSRRLTQETLLQQQKLES
jgi:hypothetical protein